MRVSDFDLLIVPRFAGAGDGDWPERWRAKLSTAKFVAPPDAHNVRSEAWTKAIVEAASATTRPALMIGHGIGAAAIVHAAQSLGGADIRGAFLVAPPDDGGAGQLGADWMAPRAPLPWRTVVVASRSDPHGDFDAIAALARAWGADLIDAGPAGGLDAASGHGPWPEGLMRLAGFIQRIGAS